MSYKSQTLSLSIIMTFLFILSSCDKKVEFYMDPPELVATGFIFTEGPHWLDDGSLIFSDIPANKVYRWRPDSEGAEVFIESSGNANGIDGMPDGTVILAQHAGRLSRLTNTGELEPIVTEYEGKRLNSPNDLAIRSDSVIFFTDPNFGVSEEDQELNMQGVYRIDTDGTLTLVYDGFILPNGITFSSDEKWLFVSDTETGQVFRFEVSEQGDLSSFELFAEIGEWSDAGGADGMITDEEGRLYTTGPAGLLVFDREGKKIAHQPFEQQVTNVEWGGEDGNTLFVTATKSVFSIKVNK